MILQETRARLSRIENMEYVFKKDVAYLLEKGMKFDKTLGEFVLNAFVSSKISLESFIIMRRIFGFVLDGIPNYTYIYQDKYEKYELLVSVNVEKYKKILEEAIM
jgi:hypothetical protein